MKSILELELEQSKVKTSHIMHFVLTLLTGFIWVIPWVIIHQLNENKKKKIEQKIIIEKMRMGNG